MVSKSDSALLIVGHGSTVNPDSSAPTLAHAVEIRRRKVFAAVECAFWKEEPSLRDALCLFDPEEI
ncbi:MAG TPA: cobalamin biosynthesis protein CbiX, partial [Blastocatellia bacterium]|nr:cobalamin biosynthesis protein CbiX [Blastocatellia bacterium]